MFFSLTTDLGQPRGRYACLIGSNKLFGVSRQDHEMDHNFSLSEQLTYCTVRIECNLKDGSSSIGTGFFFRFLEKDQSHIPSIVTNRHVVAGAETGRFRLHVADSAGGPSRAIWIDVALDQFERRWITHPDESVDLCVLPIEPLLEASVQQDKCAFYITLAKDLIPNREQLAALDAIEDVVMIGYPIGLWDSTNNLPIVRRGITATHPAFDYEGKRQFLIDAACFPGSSGSPVFLYNFGMYSNKQGGTVIGSRINLLGVLHAGPVYTSQGEIIVEDIPTGLKPVALSPIPINLGYVIRSDRLLEFEPKLDWMARLGR